MRGAPEEPHVAMADAWVSLVLRTDIIFIRAHRVTGNGGQQNHWKALGIPVQRGEVGMA